MYNSYISIYSNILVTCPNIRIIPVFMRNCTCDNLCYNLNSCRYFSLIDPLLSITLVIFVAHYLPCHSRGSLILQGI